MKITQSRIILLFFAGVLLLSANILQSLPVGTKILTSHGNVAIEVISQGLMIRGQEYDESGEFEKNVVQKKSCYSTDKLIEITTPLGKIYAAPGQKFYDASQQKFVAAQDLSRDSSFLSAPKTLSSECKNVACFGVQTLDVPALCYELALLPPHTFYATDQNLLVHNFAPAFPLIVASFEELVALGAALFCATFAIEKKGARDGKPTLVPSFPYIPDSNNIQGCIEWQAKQFKEKHTSDQKPTVIKKSGDMGYSDPSAYFAPIVGIPLDVKMCQNIVRFPGMFGPMYPLAAINGDGDVECTLYVMHCTQESYQQTMWEACGHHVFRRNDPHVAKFVAAEDKKILRQLDDAMRSWPQYLDVVMLNPMDTGSKIRKVYQFRNTHSYLEKEFYGARFGIQALARMAQRKIGPSRILQVIRYGTAMLKVTCENYRIYRDDLNPGFFVLVEKYSGKILNIGSSFNEMNEDPSQEDDEEEGEEKEGKKDAEEGDEDDKENKEAADLSDPEANDLYTLDFNKISHIKQLKHNWAALVPNENWEKIVKIIKKVLDTGVRTTRNSNYAREKIIKGKTVEVTYIVRNGVRRISNAWVR